MSDLCGALANSHNQTMFSCTLNPGFSLKMELPSSNFNWDIIPEKIAKVRDPLGHGWLFKIRGDHPNYYFLEGWKNFTKTFNLEVGYILLFCYEGGMNFSVLIFGRNSRRKEYALELVDRTRAEQNLKHKNNLHVQDDREQNLKHKKIKLEVANEDSHVDGTITEVKKPEDVVGMSMNIKKEKPAVQQQQHHHEITDHRDEAINECENNTAEKEIAPSPSTFNAGNPENLSAAGFRITLKPSHLQTLYYLNIPWKFREEAGISKEVVLFLKDPNCNFWEINLRPCTRNRMVVSKRGWKEFCLNNKLAPGDDCEFKPCSDLKDDKKTLQVEIFRKPQREGLEAVKVKRTLGTNFSGAPSFWITVTSRCLNHTAIEIPAAFVAATDLLKKKKVEIKGDEDGYVCTAELRRSTRNRLLFKNGSLRTICSRYNLKAGDIVAFRSELKSNSDGVDTFLFRILDEPPIY